MWWKQYIPKPRMFMPWMQDIFDMMPLRRSKAIHNDEETPVVMLDCKMPVGNVTRLYAVKKAFMKKEYYFATNDAALYGPYATPYTAAKAYVQKCIEDGKHDLIPKYDPKVWQKLLQVEDTPITLKPKMPVMYYRNPRADIPYMSRHQMP